MLTCVNVYADNKCSEDTARTKYNPQITWFSGKAYIKIIIYYFHKTGN